MPWWIKPVGIAISTLLLAAIILTAAMRLWWWMFTGIVAFAFDALIVGGIVLGLKWAFNRWLKPRKPN